MVRLTLHQMNPTVGDIEGNTEKILQGIAAAREVGAQLVIFPECAVTGYPAEDLLFVGSFIDENTKAIQRIAEATRGLVALVGFVHRDDDIYNAAAILADGEIKGVVKKSILPNYGVFDENRYFQSAECPVVLKMGEARVGVTICEDLWHANGPAREQSLFGGAELIVNISASPYHRGKPARREAMLATRATDYGVYVAFCNMVGGQDELVFDGNSAVFTPAGEVITRAVPFEEHMIVADVDLSQALDQRLKEPRRRAARDMEPEGQRTLQFVEVPLYDNVKPPIATHTTTEPDELEEIYRALTLGCSDYVGKNDFNKAVLGLSGGIDSALTAAIAVDALGAGNVVGVTMPSKYSSEGSVDDSVELARNLGVEIHNIPIGDPFDAYIQSLAPLFAGLEMDVAEENLQARIRGTLLMALSNKFGWLLLSTGNKSETSVGYCTLYGDMAGGFNLLKDVPKTLVYELCHWRNGQTRRPWIPTSIIEKPPSAELRPDQKDSDSLPPYAVLDPILKVLVEDDGALDGVRELYGEETVSRIVALVDRNEYKRRQAAPGVRITPRAFGKDRRYPITNRYKRPV